jgi:DNA-binding response OmpR family regulator
MTAPAHPFRILVVEDNELIGELIADLLVDAAYIVVGPVRRLADAVKAAETETFDAALLDIDLGGKPSGPVAAALARRDLPFILLTGLGRGTFPPEYAKRPIVTKPFQARDLLNTLSQTLERPRSGD